MLYDILFILFYLKLTNTYFLNHLIFRAFHCTSLAILSLKNITDYGKSITDINSPIQTLYSTQPVTFLSPTSNYYSEYFYLKLTPVYFIVYLIYDLKHCNKRIDLLLHHIICIFWTYLNIHVTLGFIMICIFTEGITFAYLIPTFKNQLIYRLIFTTIIRFPIWIFVYTYYYFYNDVKADFLFYFNGFVIATMMLLDYMWSVQNYKKLQLILKDNK